MRPTAETVCGLGNRKNEVFGEVLAAKVSSPIRARSRCSTSCRAGDRGGRRVELEERPVGAGGGRNRRIGSTSSSTARSPGSTDCAASRRAQTYMYAAKLARLARRAAVVVEDAISGVAAGRDGGFGLVVGVDRGAGRRGPARQRRRPRRRATSLSW